MHKSNRRKDGKQITTASKSLLADLLFNDRSNSMSPAHAKKRNGKRYRYYVSQAIIKGQSREAGSVARVPAHLRGTGVEMKMLISGDSGKDKPDSSLVRLIVKAHTVRESLPACSGMELSELAKHHGVGDSYISRLFRLTFLAPDITKAILEGRHPPELTGVRLIRDTRFPLDWEEQRRVLGFV